MSTTFPISLELQSALHSTAEDLDYIYHKPLHPLNLPELKTLTKNFFLSSIPCSSAQLSAILNGLICDHFVGKLNEPAVLAGASLANTWALAFCIGIILSIDLSFTVFTADSLRRRKKRNLGILYQKYLFLFTLIALHFIISVLLAESFLLRIGLGADIASSVGIYLKYLIPSIMGTLVLETIKTFLWAQNNYIVGGVIECSLVAVNYFLCHLMVDVFKFELRGVAIAKSITDTFGAVIIILYVKYSGAFRESWIPWDREAIKDWWPFFKAAVIIGSTLYIEWIAIDICAFIIHILNKDYILNAHGIALSIDIILFASCIGNMMAIEIYLGNAVGEVYKNKAKNILFLAFGLNISYIVFSLILFSGFNRIFATFSTDDPMTEKSEIILSNMLFITGLFHVFDSFGSQMGTVFRSTGKEKEIFIRWVTCYLGIIISFEWVFVIVLGYSSKGIWLSMGFGMVLMFSWMAKFALNFDWDLATRKIRQEIGKEENERDGKYIEMMCPI